MENWREHLKDKPVKYWIRAEIEEIIKENDKFAAYSDDGRCLFFMKNSNGNKMINVFLLCIS